jgi:TolB protein
MTHPREGYGAAMRGPARRLRDPALWPRSLRNLAGAAWVAGVLALCVVWAGGPRALWHAPGRAYRAVLCSGAFTGAPSWSPDGTRIVFAKQGSCSSALYVVARDGTGLHRLAASRSRDELPAWSPIGGTIAFVGEQSLDTIRPDGGGRQLLSHDESDFGVAWSPDGRRLAATHGSLPGMDDDHLDSSLVLLRADGTRIRRVLAHGPGPGTPAWSPDGARIAFIGDDGLYVIDVDGRHLRRIWEQYFGPNPNAPAWSRDGRTLSFVDEAGVELIDVAAPRLRRRIAAAGGRFGDATAWAPGDAWIAFSLSAGKRPGIYLVRPDGQGLHRLVAI